MDCGPTCLYLIAKYYGRSFNIDQLRRFSEIGKDGVSLLGLSNAAEKIGFRTLGVQPTLQQLKNASLPAILHWSRYHFVVLYKIKRDRFYIADPAAGLVALNRQEFEQRWISSVTSGEETGIALLLNPNYNFYYTHYDNSYKERKRGDLRPIFKYLQPYRNLAVQLVLSLLVGSLLQLVLPFLTQSIIDTGVNTGNIGFVKMVLIAQLALLTGRLFTEFIRGWILYHISSRINISIITDFLIKLMKLPVSYFDSKRTGDVIQRVNDHRRIQDFLTGTSLSTLFALFNLVIFSSVLASYDIYIFGVFLTTSLLYVLWILFFLRRRKRLDYTQFDISSAEQGKMVQLIQGMTEIKLQGCERTKRWEWEQLRARSFKVGARILSLNQQEQTGAFLINEGKNILITFLSATAVIKGILTLGEMLAIQYIIGQLNSPIEQMVGFVQSWQLAKISLDRLNEIHRMEDEEPSDKIGMTRMPLDKTIRLENVYFTYPGPDNEPVLKDINLIIPHGRTTAIVGASGSGKTTLLKLLLKIYPPQKGKIQVGDQDMADLAHESWRQDIGVVMQESFVFSESIAANIVVNTEQIDMLRLQIAAGTANILNFIESLPMGFNTHIGMEGTGISMGQRQRVLIARTVYKDPSYVFFDEATNSLDANNELVIMKNLSEFTKGKTVVVIAHRLSTVKNADQIVVLNNGIIAEKGTHAELTALRGEYYTLVRNQLELDD